jgi:class 3 adenylate cyclase
MAALSPVRYAQSGDVNIAYQVLGEGDVDLVVVPGFVSHLEIGMENPRLRRFVERLNRFARVISFDRRGVGMSDPVDDVPTLETRGDDLRAVMDAAGSERAFLMGVSEGAPLSILFAAAHPERVRGMILYGGMARSTQAPGYPWANNKEAIIEAALEFSLPAWGTGESLDTFAPTLADDPAARQHQAKLERYGATPGMLQKVFLMFLDTDVREVLPAVNVPTLVLHRKGDRVVNVNAGRWMAEQIRGARFVELPGPDHLAYAGDTEALLREVELFVTGANAAPAAEIDRVLATVMFTDLVGSTERAATLGDAQWRDLREGYYTLVRAELERFRGREVKTLGDGMLATFDGPARAVRAAAAIAAATPGLGLETRIGVHTGECEILAGDVVGIAVHIAARIAAMAGPGEVLVSSTVKDLVVGSLIEFSDRGAHALKGVPGEWRVFSVA